MPANGQAKSAYRGRFAPSPTGPLHFGSLVAAIGSYLQARRQGGTWLVRIEDIDPPRAVAGAPKVQLETLARFGMHPDGPVIYQSRSLVRHQAALEKLLAANLAFRCGCTRKELPSSGIYPGTCRDGLPPGKTARSVRIRTDSAGPIEIIDAIQGKFCEHPGERAGDFILLRGDGLIAYQLAVVVDDAAEGITEVVRGADLLDSTPRQVHIYASLGLEPPKWLHLPVIVDENGRKLSKSDQDDPVDRHPTAQAFRLALRALGHEPHAGVRSLEAMWRYALNEWTLERVPRGPVAIGVHPD